MESKEFLERNGIHPVMANRVTQNFMIQLLDEYAQQMAIEFAEWINVTYTNRRKTGEYTEDGKWFEIGTKGILPHNTTSELYQIFLNEKQK